GVHAGTQHDRLLAVIGHLEFARHEHHALGGGMPVACDLRTAGDLEVDVRIRRRGIPLEYGDLAALREKLRTWPPLEPRVVMAPGQGLPFPGLPRLDGRTGKQRG